MLCGFTGDFELDRSSFFRLHGISETPFKRFESRSVVENALFGEMASELCLTVVACEGRTSPPSSSMVKCALGTFDSLGIEQFFYGYFIGISLRNFTSEIGDSGKATLAPFVLPTTRVFLAHKAALISSVLEAP